MAHGAVMFSNGYRARRKAAAKKNNHRVAGRALRRAAAQIHPAVTPSVVPPFGLIEGGFRRL
jgi:hypothetical protein